MDKYLKAAIPSYEIKEMLSKYEAINKEELVSKYKYKKLSNHIKLFKLQNAQFMLPIRIYETIFRELTVDMPDTFWSASADLEHLERIAINYKANTKPQIWAPIKAQLKGGNYKKVPYGAQLYLNMLEVAVEKLSLAQ